MAAKVIEVLQQLLKPIKIVKWKVSEGNSISIGCVFLLYELDGDDKHLTHKLKSTKAGTVHKLLAQEGDVVKPGECLFKLQACAHPTVMRDMCAECGADLRKEDIITSASVPMVHSVPELKVSLEQAQKIGKADVERLLKSRKLVLLVDLDQTLIHTTNDNIPANIKDVYHFQLYGNNSPWYHTKLRPGTHQFLENMSPYFELHICTFGARNYAHMIAMFLDQDGKLFSQRILSRDECFNPTSKTANLKALFPCGDNMVCIIDDREDVWSHATNLIHVKPYHFFQHTGDINAPPGLDKQENDEKDTKTDSKDEKNVTLNGSLEESKLEKESCLTTSQEENDIKSGETNEVTDNEEKSNVKLVQENSDTKEEFKTDSSVSNNNQDINNAQITKEDNIIEKEDPDDYLLYLEDILKTIHKAFYDKLDSGNVPDLKKIIPEVRREVLKDTRLVFSGLVPTHIKLEQSKAYQVAKSLGAVVTQDLEENTTHLVAVRPGTAKVNAGRRRKNLKIVTSDWLWACAERWSKVDERHYTLGNKGSKNRHPPPHCSSPEHNSNFEEIPDSTIRKRTSSGRFMDTINPLMSFSSADIADMDREVEDIFNESESEGETISKKSDKTKIGEIKDTVESDEDSSSSIESLTGEHPHGWRPFANTSKRNRDDEDLEDESTVDEFPSTKFRRGEQLSSDLDIGQNSNSDGSMDAPDEVDDGDWNMMGAALEREFLSNN